MKSFLTLFFLAVGIGFIVFGYQQGQANSYCECNCASSFETFPNYPTFYFIDDYKSSPFMHMQNCELVGSSAAQVPLFIDVYAIAGIAFLLALFNATKPNSTVV